MSSLDNRQSNYWRSLAELENEAQVDELLAREFPEQQELLSDPISRR